MKFATVNGYEIVGGIDETAAIKLNPADAVLLSFDKFDFNMGTTLIADRSSNIDFVGLSISRDKLSAHAEKTSSKLSKFTRKW